MGRFDTRFWVWVQRRGSTLAILFFLLNVGLKLPWIAGSSLFLDEAVAIFETQGSIGETIQFSAADPTPPLYYLTVGLWCKVFGLSEMSARFPSMLFSSATAAFIFLLGLRHFGARTGFFAALFFTLSSVGMVFAHEARAYALAGMLMVLSYWLFLEIAKKDRPGWKLFVAIGIVNALLLYTHYLTSMGLAAQALLSLWLIRENLRKFLHFAASQVMVLIVWLPWVAYNRSLLKDSKVTSWLKAPDLTVLDNVLTQLAGSAFLKWFGLAIFVLGGMAVAYWYSRPAKPRETAFDLTVLAGWMFLALALQFVVAKQFMPVFKLRYVLYTLPAGCLLLSALLTLIPKFRLLQYGLVAVQLVGSATTMNLNPQKVENWRDAVAMVKEMENDKTAMVVIAYYQYVPFAYYYNRAYFEDYNHTQPLFGNDNIHFGVDSTIVPDIDDSLVTNVILILSHDQLVDPTGSVFHCLDRRYCIQRKGTFPGIKLYQFQKPPCSRDSSGHFFNDFEAAPGPSEVGTIIELPDSSAPNNHGTMVGPGHEFSATMTWRTGDIYEGNFRSADLSARCRLHDPGKKVVLVFSMDHEGEAYNWVGFELQQDHPFGEWFQASYKLGIPEIKGPDDKVSVYFWSPDGAKAEFDDLGVNFGDD